MKSELPHFTPFDNPAAHAGPLSRRLTHLYLIFFNLKLLFFPSSLCADWTMGSIPLVASWIDSRNLQTFSAFVLLFVVGVRSIHPRTPRKQALSLMMGLSLMVFPFIPASNLFFYVGFVVAERVLYIPSLGFCLLIGLGFQNICRALSAPGTSSSSARRTSCRKGCPPVLLLFVLAVFACKTVRRNYDWADEYSLFTSAVRVNQHNAKLWNNVGHALEARNNYSEALHFFQKAVEAQPNDMGAHINVGRTFVNLGLYKEAEAAYTRALDYFPKPRKGMTYHTRVSPKDLTVFINLANLLVKDQNRLEEADALLRRAISLREDYVDAYQNRGSLLVRLQRFSEAEQMYRAGLKHQPTNAALLYNLGVVLLETNRTEEAYLNFHKALFYEPGHEQTKFVLAASYADTSDPQLREKARLLYEELSQGDFDPVRVHFGLALLYSDASDFETAIKHYNTVLKHEATHRSSLFNLALMYNNELRQPLSAIPLLKQLIESHPSHTKSYLLLGDIELSVRKNPTEARRLFEKAVSLEPGNLQARHNLCVSIVDSGDLVGGERCLVEAARLATDKDHYIFKHLSIVRARLTASAGTPRSPSEDKDDS
uniref:dolichyl-phosphate-mannose--protein mannosyltransferase n=4 Tax=Schistocephalus solidus TaxID=70667 RepID=A0A0X3NXZ5_SCHSO